jgi:alkylation response protein AidB-like acyl-CoA dehydrogenase
MDIVEQFRKAGFFHMLVPSDLGGRQADPVTTAKVVEEIAAADGSAGWVLMIANQNAAFSGLMEADHARTIWGSGGIACGTARPIGRAEWKDGHEPGYRVSGRWPFASGSSHADWFAGECVVYDGDSPRKDANGNDVTRMVFVPRSEATIHDTWFTTGLRGTASNDFSIDGAFVPVGRGFQMIVDRPKHPWALFNALPLMFVNQGGQSTGIARGAIREAIRLAKTKKGWGDQPLSAGLRLQSVVAEATVAVESAREYLWLTTSALYEAAQAGRLDDPIARSRVRLATSHANRASVHAVDLVHGALGTTALFPSTPLERAFRDIHMAAAHVIVGQMSIEAAGRVELGKEPEFPFF